MRPLGRPEVLGPMRVALCSGVPAASSSDSRLRLRLTELIREVFRYWTVVGFVIRG